MLAHCFIPSYKTFGLPKPVFVSYNEAGELKIILADIGGHITLTTYPKFCRKLFADTFSLPTPSFEVVAVPFDHTILDRLLTPLLPRTQLLAADALRFIMSMLDHSTCKYTCKDGFGFLYATLGSGVFPHLTTGKLPEMSERRLVTKIKESMHLYVLHRISYDDQHSLPFGESHGIPEPDRIATLKSSKPSYEEDAGRVSAAAKNGEPDQPAISLLALLATLEMDCVIWGDRDVEPLPHLGCKTTDSSTQSGRWLQFASGVQYSGSRRHQIDPISCWKRCNDRSGSSRPLLWVKWTGSSFGNLSYPLNTPPETRCSPI